MCKINKSFLLLLVVVFQSMVINAQSNKTFDSDLFSIEYPASFKSSPIQNAPHMLLKLESNDYYFSISCWNSGIDENKSIWDYDLNNVKKALLGDVVSITKETIQIKSGPHRCLKVMENLHNNQQGIDVNVKVLSYFMFHKGCLFSFVFKSEGKYNKGSITTYPENILKGLRLKENGGKGINYENSIIESIKTINKQFPMQVDDCTTYMQMILSGKTIILKAVVEDDCDGLIDYEDFKKKASENFAVALEKPFVEYLDKKGYSIVYMIFNANDRLKKKIQITGRDVLDYY